MQERKSTGALMQVKEQNRACFQEVVHPVLEQVLVELVCKPPKTRNLARDTILGEAMKPLESGGEAIEELVSFATNRSLTENFAEQTSPACAAACIASSLNALVGRKEWAQDTILPFLVEMMEERVAGVQSRMERLLGVSLSALGQAQCETFADLKAFVWRESEGDPGLSQLRSALEAMVGPQCNAEEEEEDDEDLKNSAEEGSWSAEKELKEYFRRSKGLKKLLAEKPSTACIGNWGIKEVVARVSRVHAGDRGFSCNYFCGKSIKCKFRVKATDSDEDVDLQWAMLWEAFTKRRGGLPAHALVLHLKNHYAPIFGMKTEASGERLILTSRKGQAPKHWLTFTEVRELLLRWNGYSILIVSSQ